MRPEHRTAAYWVQRAAEPDEVLLSPQDIQDHAAGLAQGRDGRPLGQYDLLAAPDPAVVAREIAERMEHMRSRLQSGEYVDAQGAPIAGEALAPFATPEPLPPLSPSLHVAVAPVALRCGPRQAGFYTRPVEGGSIDLRFDRNQCSLARPQEPVLILMRWANGMRFARTRYAMGFIGPDVPLSPAIPPADREAWVRAPRVIARRAFELEGGVQIPRGTLLAPGSDSSRVRYATTTGFAEGAVPDGATGPAHRPLTRRAFIEEAFRMLDRPYGWGDAEGGIDCSRMVMDVFETFGLGMQRHSAAQASAGSWSIDVSAVTSEAEKGRLIDAAARRGIVLLHFPGHIMLYLGRNDAGEPMAIHSFAEYLVPCTGGGETLLEVDRADVSNLELGRGTSRRAFIERLTKIVVFGRAPGPELQIAELRPAAPAQLPAECRDDASARVFVSPAQPHARGTVRVIATSTRAMGPVEVALYDATGRRVAPPVHRLGGPPYTVWAAMERPAAGSWTAVIGDGSRTIACERFRVAGGPSRPGASEGEAVYQPRWRWEEDTENLYSAFVEQLFDYPLDDDLTWNNLQTLLRQPTHNLLHDHLGLGEDDELRMQPDCADLPYLLRAYFAWKLRLPMGYRSCSRGREGQPPACRELHTNLDPRASGDEIEAARVWLRDVQTGARSSNGRTHPRDEETDLYPIPLTREALRPGAVFGDPYGHTYVIADWLPQAAGGYGVLVGAEAQPDGTIGRRRFWRGTFLFRPDTDDVGAGFKWWRPLIHDRAANTITPLPNREIRDGQGWPPFSEQQYQGTVDDFYDRMEALINPRPLDAESMLDALLDALEEAATRRVLSVDNGEEYFARGGGVISMPDGYAIFETSGAWEDYATPSRDMRLLIAIDAVLDFPAAMRRMPEHYQLHGAGEIDAAVTRLQAQLQQELRTRGFTYRRSDGSEQRLTLQDLVDRQANLEIAYNPNDCPEHRWGAPEGSPERTTCRRTAPGEQRARMERYRTWFHDRTRPPR